MAIAQTGYRSSDAAHPSMVHRHREVLTFPATRFSPEEGESQGRFLIGGNRKVHEVDPGSGTGRGWLLNVPPFVGCPVQPERCLGLHAKRPARPHRADAPVERPDLEGLQGAPTLTQVARR